VLEVHETFANVMWAYLVAHAALALLHEWAGHRTIRRMFSA
jgi:cytochrome b561